MKCIIKEKITLGSKVPWPAYDMARIRQEPPPRATRTVRYVNTVTHEEYLCLAGGFAWPGLKPGYAVVVAVQQTEDEGAPLFKTIAEVEEYDVETLLQKTWELYLMYGVNCITIPWSWYGDPETGLSPFMDRFTRKLLDTGEERPFFLVPPPQYREPDAFGAYCRTVYSLLRPERKQLILGVCTRLRAQLNEMGNLAAVTGNVEEYPAIAALGYVLSAMITYEPWMMEIEEPYSRMREEADTDSLWGRYSSRVRMSDRQL